MEKPLIKKEEILKSNEKSEKKREIIVKKRINFMSRISLTKSPSFQSNIAKTKANEKSNDSKYKEIKKCKIKMPSELIAKKKMLDYITLNMKKPKTISLNSQSEIIENNPIYKNSNEDKKKLLGQIITDFSTNKMINKNIFDDGNQIIFHRQQNNDNHIDKNLTVVNNNLMDKFSINNDLIRKENTELNETNPKTSFNNNIKEIQIKSFKTNNTNKNNEFKTSISLTRGNYYKRRPFYSRGMNSNDKNNYMSQNTGAETPIKNTTINSKFGVRTSFTKKVMSSFNNLNTENIRNRNKQKMKETNNNLTYNDNYEFGRKIKDKSDNNNNNSINNNNSNNINNINNINNNISLNNKYNFYIKIGKSNKEGNKKDIKDIQVKLTNFNNRDQGKGDQSPRVIKKLIVECDIDNINKNLNSDNKKGVNVNIKPLYKKVEIEKVLLSHSIDKDDINKRNINLTNHINYHTNNNNINNNNQRGKNKTSRSFNKKAFKFLVHQAYKNRDLSSSFNRYYKSKHSLKGRSQSIKDNKNISNSLNYSNENDSNMANRSLGLMLYNDSKKNLNSNIKDKDSKFKKYKNFYKSFRNIGRMMKRKNVSYEENLKNNNSEINKRSKINNMTCVLSNNCFKKRKDNIELTSASISITNEDNNTNTNKNTINDNLNINEIRKIRNKGKNKFISSKKNIKMKKMMHGPESSEKKNNTPDSKIIHSKVNSSFSTYSINSNFNSINTTYNNYNTNNMNTNAQHVTSTSMSSNLSLAFINLETLYVLEEKSKIILEKVKKYKKCSKECYEFINYYFVHQFYNEELKVFKQNKNQQIISIYLKNELLCYFLCYDISFTDDFKQAEILLKSIFTLLYKNFLIFLSLVISQYKNKENNIIIILNKVVKNNLYNNNLNDSFDYSNIDENKFIEIIENNSKKIIDYYKMLIENIYMKIIDENNNTIQFPNCINTIISNNLENDKLEKLIATFFSEAHKSISEYNFDLLKEFFYSFLYKKASSNLNNIITQSNKKGQNPIINVNTNTNINSNIISENHNSCLLPKIKNHKYTLVLDLDETLVYSQKNFYYKLKNNNTNSYNNKINIPKKTVILRPGLHEFLHDMKLLYELVIFSAGTPDYVDPIIELIEKDEKFFDYVLYRQHIMIDENGDGIKNLSLLGRDLKNIIIIDDVQRYFKLQKENGICIRPFCGNILSDRKTLKTLNNILQKIRFDADETKDIRISLEKYKHLLYPIVTNSNE